MIILSVEEIGKNKCKICLDSGERFLLSGKETVLYGLREQQELSQETYDALCRQLRKSCLHRCGSLLQSRDYTVAKLRQKLSEDYPASVTEEVLDELQKAGYLDDLRFAGDYIRYHTGRSLRQLKADLQKKGISSETLEQALAELSDQEDLQEREAEQIRCFLEKKMRKQTGEVSREEMQKWMAALYRKGYSPEMIRRSAEIKFRENR